MASYTTQRGPNGTVSPSYPHQLPAPGHSLTSYASSQPLPSMAPSSNGSNYGAQSYHQSQSYQHSQPSYQTQQGQQAPPPPHQQAYQQPPLPGPPQHALPSPTSSAHAQSSSGPAQSNVGKLDPVSTVVGGRRFSYVLPWNAWMRPRFPNALNCRLRYRHLRHIFLQCFMYERLTAEFPRVQPDSGATAHSSPYVWLW